MLKRNGLSFMHIAQKNDALPKHGQEILIMDYYFEMYFSATILAI